MPGEFEPDERQKRLIKDATSLARRASGPSRFASEQLVARMTSEGLLVTSVDDENSDAGRDEFGRLEQPRNVEAQRLHGFHAAEAPVCRVVLAAAVDAGEDVAPGTGGISSRHPMANCVSATAFKVPRHVLLFEFDQQVSHRETAMVESVAAVLRAFPHAEFIDLNGQNSLIEQLAEASSEVTPDPKQLDAIYRCTLPSDDLVALAASAVDGVLARRTVGARLVEAEVFEVHPEFGIAHFATPDGRMLCVTERTPGITSLSRLEDGQRYRCWVQGRSNLVVRAEPTD